MACHVSTDNKTEFGKPIKGTIVVKIGAFKSAVTKKNNEMNTKKAPSIWQPNYYEDTIRNEKDHYRIRKYILQYPLKWELDEYYKL